MSTRRTTTYRLGDTASTRTGSPRSAVSVAEKLRRIIPAAVIAALVITGALVMKSFLG